VKSDSRTQTSGLSERSAGIIIRLAEDGSRRGLRRESMDLRDVRELS
jgi:hypothetical protein